MKPKVRRVTCDSQEAVWVQSAPSWHPPPPKDPANRDGKVRNAGRKQQKGLGSGEEEFVKMDKK